jgi:predicted protein tyrosine phosphatase
MIPASLPLAVCGIPELSQGNLFSSHVISLLDPDHPDVEALAEHSVDRRTILRFHDIIEPAEGRTAPSVEHMATIVDKARHLGQGDAEGKLLIHCHMGVSRSTAAMLAVLATIRPEASGEDLFVELAMIRPQAWPNSLMIRMTDELLSRGGDLTSALRRHYGRQLTAYDYFAEWMTRLGRSAEVDLAIR